MIGTGCRVAYFTDVLPVCLYDGHFISFMFCSFFSLYNIASLFVILRLSVHPSHEKRYGLRRGLCRGRHYKGGEPLTLLQALQA